MYTKLLLWFCLTHVHFSRASESCAKYLCRSETITFRDYVAIKTTRSEDLRSAVDFFKRLGAEQGVRVTVFEARPNYPVIIFKWPGRDPSLKSIVLLSHLDVNSACYEDGWDYPPFSGEVNDNCEIVGRGTQTQKSLTIQHYEALSRLKQNNVTLLRTVYMVITSDQTTGSRNGIELFVKTKTFRRMNVGFTLGVGGPTAERKVLLYNRFKTKYVIRIDCYGPGGSSAFYPPLNSTAVEVCGNILNSYNRYREQQYRLSLRTNDTGDYTTINFLGGRSRVEYNVILAHVAVHYVANLALNTTVEDFIELLRGWILGAGGNVTVSSLYKEEGTYYTKTDGNPYYEAIKEAFGELNIPFVTRTTPSITDTTFVVKAGIPAFGLTPIRNTQPLVNGVNERLSFRIYTEGLRIIRSIILRLANIPDDEVADDPRTYLQLPKSRK